MVLKIQEILKIKMEDPNSKIDLIHNHFKNAVIKMHIKNNLLFIDLFMNNSIENVNSEIKKSETKDHESIVDKNKATNNILHLAFDYYILKKSDSKIFLFLIYIIL